MSRTATTKDHIRRMISRQAVNDAEHEMKRKKSDRCAVTILPGLVLFVKTYYQVRMSGHDGPSKHTHTHTRRM